jgi:hypothetical protein
MALSFNSDLVHICQFRVYLCVRLMPRSFCHFTVLICAAPMISSDVFHVSSVYDLFQIASSKRLDIGMARTRD